MPRFRAAPELMLNRKSKPLAITSWTGFVGTRRLGKQRVKKALVNQRNLAWAMGGPKGAVLPENCWRRCHPMATSTSSCICFSVTALKADKINRVNRSPSTPTPTSCATPSSDPSVASKTIKLSQHVMTSSLEILSPAHDDQPVLIFIKSGAPEPHRPHHRALPPRRAAPCRAVPRSLR